MNPIEPRLSKGRFKVDECETAAQSQVDKCICLNVPDSNSQRKENLLSRSTFQKFNDQRASTNSSKSSAFGHAYILYPRIHLLSRNPKISSPLSRYLRPDFHSGASYRPVVAKILDRCEKGTRAFLELWCLGEMGYGVCQDLIYIVAV